ncbi:unnamed protein product [Sphagnum jensenii]|uniref:DYW domain-containing protein n=1 Tax=Sphagnum jensenii TaxID=128206 RepID=A0ABP1AX54_9BRYO
MLVPPRRGVDATSKSFLVAMAMCHRLSLDSQQTGHIVTSGNRTLATTRGGNVGPTVAYPAEKLWRQFFSDPSQWCDCRQEKVNERHPDFKHKRTQAALWLDNRQNPSWVGAKLAAMASGTPQLDSFTWNRRLARYVAAGRPEKTLELFREMQLKGMTPDRFTYVPVLNACASLRALEEGRQIHAQLIQTGCEPDVFVGTSLVDMYAKCGRMDDAERVFNNMPSRAVVSWNAMILGHVRCAQGQKALVLFQQMQEKGVRPDSVTYVGVLNACASVVALEEGRCTHKQIIQNGWDSNVFVATSLVDMYAKCGSMKDAWRVFNKMPSRDVGSWNAMLGGCAMHGHGKEALQLFGQMGEEGVQPNDITFVCLLSACSHAGLVDEGMDCYASMSTVHMISPKLEHYTCIVDLLGRAGRLQEAENMIMMMPGKPYVAAYKALLGACRIHGNIEMGERVAKIILQLEPKNAAGYVMLSNIYASAGKRHLVDKVEQQRTERGAKKQPGLTWIEVNNEVHTFIVDDQDHPQMIEIHAELKRLSGLMLDAGYREYTNLVLYGVEEEENVFRLCHHSEKLAIAFGLINTAPGTPLRITKKIAGLWGLPQLHKVHFKDGWESNHGEGCQSLSSL